MFGGQHQPVGRFDVTSGGTSMLSPLFGTIVAAGKLSWAPIKPLQKRWDTAGTGTTTTKDKTRRTTKFPDKCCEKFDANVK